MHAKLVKSDPPEARQNFLLAGVSQQGGRSRVACGVGIY